MFKNPYTIALLSRLAEITQELNATGDSTKFYTSSSQRDKIIYLSITSADFKLSIKKKGFFKKKITIETFTMLEGIEINSWLYARELRPIEDFINFCLQAEENSASVTFLEQLEGTALHVNQFRQKEKEEKKYLSITEAAEYLGVSPRTLGNWRYRKTGVKSYKKGQRIQYKLSDLKAWKDGRKK